ncbi:hypothetical protein [Streptomyces sp. NPDC048196]
MHARLRVAAPRGKLMALHEQKTTKYPEWAAQLEPLVHMQVA